MKTPARHFNKTRIAPTPSGFLHLGNAYSFALTASIAKETGAKILLRIDDLDRDRVNEAYVQDVLDTLYFLNISWDEGPRNAKEYESEWSQIHRMAIYEKALTQLKNSGKVFACTCSRAQIQRCTCADKNIPLDTPNASWRLRTDNETEITINTLNDGTTKARLPAEMKNFIVRKKDGYPAYQLTSLCDDLHFGIDLIIRGEDLWASTIAQHYLAGVLQQPDFFKITFHHHPLIMETSGNKLSKSAGATSIKYLREMGRTREEVYLTLPRV